MLNNEEKGIIISRLESIDSIFGNLNFSNEEVPWNHGIIFDSNYVDPLNQDFEYFVKVLTGNFVDIFIKFGVSQILDNLGQLNAEKHREVYEFITKNSVILDKSISSLKGRISEFVRGFRDATLNLGAFKEREEQIKACEDKIPIINAETKRDNDFFMKQTLSRLPQFDERAYRIGQLKTHFTVRCSECGLDMHFYDEDLSNNGDIASIVSRALDDYIFAYCTDDYTGEIKENIKHEILPDFGYIQFDTFNLPPQSIFFYNLGILHQHLSMNLSDGRKIHFDENDPGWTKIVNILNREFKNWSHPVCPEVPWRDQEDDSAHDFL